MVEGERMPPDVEPTPLACPACKAVLSASEVISNCTGYWRALEVTNFRCPHCQDRTEVQVRPGRLAWGYSYAAGTVHFCAMIECVVDALDVVQDTEGLSVSLGEQHWHLR
jgi:hypothetical protein